MRCTSDMSEKQWEMIRRLLKQKGYRSIEKRREQINAVLYLVKTGCRWRNLPKDCNRQPHPNVDSALKKR